MRMYGRDRGGYGGGGGGRYNDDDRGGGYGGGRGGGGYGGGSGGSGGSFDKPVKEGQEYDVTVEAVGAKGDGICKVNNFVVFVRGGQQGEKLRVRVTKVFNRFAVAESVGAATGGSSEPAAEEPMAEESMDGGEGSGEEQ